MCNGGVHSLKNEFDSFGVFFLDIIFYLNFENIYPYNFLSEEKNY